MFVISVHWTGGSTVETVEPEKAYLVKTRSDAEELRDMLIDKFESEDLIVVNMSELEDASRSTLDDAVKNCVL